jgi:hypothetical protein
VTGHTGVFAGGNEGYLGFLLADDGGAEEAVGLLEEPLEELEQGLQQRLVRVQVDERAQAAVGLLEVHEVVLLDQGLQETVLLVV